jgi:hypothetical protein
MSSTTTPLTNGTPHANGTPSGNGTPAPAQDAAPAPPLSTVINGQDRGKNGHFSKGNKCGQGNPFYRRCAMLREQACAEISADEVRHLMRRLYCAALEGDVAATVVLLAYLLGKPAKVVDPDGCDDDEWRRMRNVPSQSEFACANIDGIPTEAAIDKLRQCRERRDPFDRANRPNAQFVLDEINAQRRRRK